MIKILIIKLGAKGDVVRTLPLLKAIKKQYPDSQIHWLTKPESKEILALVPEINNLHVLPEYPRLDFDILYNLDVEEEATSIAMNLKSNKKLGFYSDQGYPSAFNISAEYYLNTIFDDELKKNNKKTYQQMMFEASELIYTKENYCLVLDKKTLDYASDFKKTNNIKDELIGIHMGASSRWPSKAWHKDNLKEFIKLAKNKGYEIVLLAGASEAQKQEEIARELSEKGIDVLKNNPNNSDKEFAAIVNICDKIVCADSYALHIALSLNKPTIALFFCTSPYEVEGYGLLTKLVSPMLMDFFPEKSDVYDEALTKSISPNKVLEYLN